MLYGNKTLIEQKKNEKKLHQMLDIRAPIIILGTAPKASTFFRHKFRLPDILIRAVP